MYVDRHFSVVTFFIWSPIFIKLSKINHNNLSDSKFFLIFFMPPTLDINTVVNFKF